MTEQLPDPRIRFHVHLSNVTGKGASELARSLLPELEALQDCRIGELFLPEKGALASYQPRDPAARRHVVKRRGPNALSRLMECVLRTRRFRSEDPILVLGDLPLRGVSRQVVFVQTPHLGTPDVWTGYWPFVKYWIARSVFSLNSRYASRVVVQTEAMRSALVRRFPEISGRVSVISQPVPDWLLQACIVRKGMRRPNGGKLTLFYPAASYPHKNHALLARVGELDGLEWPVGRLLLTIDPDRHPSPGVSWIHCIGMLDPASMVEAYESVDALLFLSKAESYGFPLVEAMHVGLPIVCPDLPYARELCGDQAVYCDVSSIDSVREAVMQLSSRLAQGWWPDWTSRLALLPRDWADVARALARELRGT